MAVLHGLCQLSEQKLGNRLSESLAPPYVRVKVTASAEFCHEAQVALRFKRVKELHYVLVL